jgi:glycosyltransferase involved in cell wall biosynthesis
LPESISELPSVKVKQERFDKDMSGENGRIKIAYLSGEDAQDRLSWSGSAYYMAQTLQKYCGEVSYIGPIDYSRERLIGKVINKISRLFLKKTYFYNYSFLVANRYAKVAAQKLANQSFDVIVAAAGATEIAFLETDLPIVSVEDATYSLLLDYYPYCSNLHKRSIHEINTIQNLALKKASMVIYSSAWAARSAIEDYGADPAKIHVVPFGANLDESPLREVALARKTSDRCCLLFLAAEWSRKGGDIAFETLLELEEMDVQAELIVSGCIPPKKFAHKHMRVIPFLNKNDERQRKELEKLLVAADFLLLPTRADCTPMVFCEANAFGLPVITTNTGGVPEVIRDGENGYLLPLDARGDAYAQVIAKVYRDDRRYTELVRASRAAFDDRLNWDAWGAAVKKILAELLSREIP